MFPGSQRLRLLIAAFCGIAFLATLQQGSMLALTVFLHGEHVMRVVQEGGEIELVFHHQHVQGHADDDDDDQLAQTGIHLNDHHHHGDHVIKLASHNDSLLTNDNSLRALSVSFGVPWIALLVVVPHYEHAPIVRARPPPLIGSGALHCLRTTVLVV